MREKHQGLVAGVEQAPAMARQGQPEPVPAVSGLCPLSTEQGTGILRLPAPQNVWKNQGESTQP